MFVVCLLDYLSKMKKNKKAENIGAFKIISFHHNLKLDAGLEQSHEFFSQKNGFNSKLNFHHLFPSPPSPSSHY